MFEIFRTQFFVSFDGMSKVDSLVIEESEHRIVDVRSEGLDDTSANDLSVHYQLGSDCSRKSNSPCHRRVVPVSVCHKRRLDTLLLPIRIPYHEAVRKYDEVPF